MNILLHTCCENCASRSIKKLITGGHEVTVFFSNSNITPYQAFLDRRKSVKDMAVRLNIDFISDDYQHKNWLSYVDTLNNNRCLKCFDYSMKQVEKKFLELGIFDLFTTTRALSGDHTHRVLHEINQNYPSYFQLKLRNKNNTIINDQSNNYTADSHCSCDFVIRNLKQQSTLVHDI